MISELSPVHGGARSDGFFELWTRKEAVTKALGASLATTLKRLEFERDGSGRIRLAALDGDRASVSRWVVIRLDAGPGHVAALATTHPCCELQRFTWNDSGRLSRDLQS